MFLGSLCCLFLALVRPIAMEDLVIFMVSWLPLWPPRAITLWGEPLTSERWEVLHNGRVHCKETQPWNQECLFGSPICVVWVLSFLGVDSYCLIQKLKLQERCLVLTSAFGINAPSVFCGLVSEHAVEGMFLHNTVAVFWWQFYLSVLQTVHLPTNSVILYCDYDIKTRKLCSRLFLESGYNFKKLPLLG